MILKSTGRTLSEVVLFGCVVILLRTLWNFSASLPRNVNVVAQLRTTSRSVLFRRGRCCSTLDDFSGVLHRCGRCCSTRTISSTISGSFVKRQRKRPGRIVSCDHGCWTRTRRQNSSSRYLSSYADKVRFCRPTPEARDSSLTSS